MAPHHLEWVALEIHFHHRMVPSQALHKMKENFLADSELLALWRPEGLDSRVVQKIGEMALAGAAVGTAQAQGQWEEPWMHQV